MGRPRKSIYAKYKKGFCESCGFTGEAWQLDVDHIDGDCHNNTPYNLQTLCPNCHRAKSNSVSGDIRKALRIRREYGLRNGGIPYGYEADSKGVLHRNEKEWAVIQQAHELRRNGLSLAKIIEVLGPVSRKNTNLVIPAIHKICKGVSKGVL